MTTSRTLRLTASFAAAVVAASLALGGVASGSSAAGGTHLGTDHLAQSYGRSVGESAALDAGAVSELTGVHFDVGAVVGFRREQAAQYLVDHALALSQAR